MLGFIKPLSNSMNWEKLLLRLLVIKSNTHSNCSKSDTIKSEDRNSLLLLLLLSVSKIGYY